MSYDLNWNGHRFNRQKDAAEEDHRKPEIVGEGLGFEDLLDGDGDQRTQS